MLQTVQNISNPCTWTQSSRRRQRRRNYQADLKSSLPQQVMKQWNSNQQKSIQTQLEEQRTKNSSSEQELKMDIISKPYFQQRTICINHGNIKHKFPSWSQKIQVRNMIIGVQILSNSSLEITDLEKSHSQIFQNLMNYYILYCKNESRSSNNKFLFAFLVFENIRQLILNRLVTQNMSNDSIDKFLADNLSSFFVNTNQQATFWNSKIIVKIQVSSDIKIENDPFMRSQNQLGPFLAWPRYCEYYIEKYGALDKLLFGSQLLEEIKTFFKKQKYGRIICSYIKENLHEIIKQLLDIFYFIKEGHRLNPIMNQYTLWKEQLFGKITGQERYYAQKRLNRYWMSACVEQLKKLIKFVIKAASAPLCEDQEQRDSNGLFIATENNLYNFWKSLKKLHKLNLKLRKNKEQRFDFLENFIISCLNRFLNELSKLQFDQSGYVSIFLQKKIIFLVISYAHISKMISNQQSFKVDIHQKVKEKIIQKLQQFKKTYYEDVIQPFERRKNYQNSLKDIRQKWKDLNNFCEIARKKGQRLQEYQQEEVFIYIFIDIVGQDIVDCQLKAASITEK